MGGHARTLATTYIHCNRCSSSFPNFCRTVAVRHTFFLITFASSHAHIKNGTMRAALAVTLAIVMMAHSHVCAVCAAGRARRAEGGGKKGP